DRKTSVLKRDREAAPTRLLGARTDFDADADTAAEPLSDEAYAAIGGDSRGNLPGFLDSGSKKDRKSRTKATRNSKSDAADAKASEGKRPGDDASTMVLPPAKLLNSDPKAGASAVGKGDLQSVANRLQATLEEFGSTSRVVGWTAGPSVTTFKIAMGEGERVAKISNLESDIALSLAARSVRIFSPIPGTSLVGIEVPNEKRQSVYLGDVLPFAQGGPLEAGFGRDSEGNPIVVDLAKLPHLLVAGTTGSGKSVMLNSIIISILMRATPEQVRFIMVDPKRVEFADYAGLPHLYVPVVTEPRQATSALQWAVSEMERRLKVFNRAKVRDIGSYNSKVESGAFKDEPEPVKTMPFFVIVIDELSDLMMVSGKEVEASIVRIAQLGRAAGIHLVVATQRPSADVVTGLIKANIDNRVALSVDNGMNSRIILDQNGAERLLGNGDMLIKLRGRSPKRAQGCFVSDKEIKDVVDFIKNQIDAEYHEEILSMVAPGMAPGQNGAASMAGADDSLFWEAAQLVVDSQLGSTSALQRHLKVGYARAGRIMDMLEQKGVVGPPDGSKPREVLMDAAKLEELRSAESVYEGV
ncbi:MAG: DNA translocase FtsK, partial [Atopobiaceae bacterium]|nr:DNA translocase FtsK [Atopobiaceae bacterium]